MVRIKCGSGKVWSRYSVVQMYGTARLDGVVAAGSAFIVPISATVCTPYKYDCRQALINIDC